MQVIHPRCCGLDVHKKDGKACVLLTHADGVVASQVRTFSTMTDGLLALADWLRACNVTEVAMESTGISWRPVYKSSRRIAPSSLSMPSTSRRCRGARPMSRTASGSPIYCAMGC